MKYKRRIPAIGYKCGGAYCQNICFYLNNSSFTTMVSSTSDQELLFLKNIIILKNSILCKNRVVTKTLIAWNISK